MRHFLGGILVVCSLAVFAQDAPKAEIFAGFSYANYELLAPTQSFSNGTETITGSSGGRLGLLGWNASVAVNVNRWFSFATDFSGYYSGSSASVTTTETLNNPCEPVSCLPETITNTDVDSNPKIHNFLFGPQFSHPGRKVKPFAHFLFGGAHSDITRSASSTISGGGIGTITGTSLPVLASSGSTGFAMAVGAGVDYLIKHDLAWRIESDYLTNQGSSQNHVRISTGLVWRVGN